MRLFLAQAATLDDYKGVQARFSPCLEGRWRTESSLHATVLFLGERFSMAEVIATVSALTLQLDDAPIEGVGLFEPNRIFYAAAAHPTLLETYRVLCHAFGIQRRDLYTPHVTLMRCKKIDIPCLRAKIITRQRLGIIAGPLLLMRSTLTPDGAVYEVLHRF